MKKQIIDISYNCKNSINSLNLEKRLSNLYPYQFRMGGILIESWEGFIQSLKTPDRELKRHLWTLHGYQAWKQGQNIPWWEKQEVYWIDNPIDRHSKDYTHIITVSYDALFEHNEDFRKALEESLPYKLDHSKGKTDKHRTLLTKKEYLFQLERLRKKLKPQKFLDLMDLFK
jgi:hypothetical protein